MKGFSPFKSRANSFKYTPRYYDPEKESRERRREELFGRRSDNKEGEQEYIPGQFIRSQRAARHSRHEGKRKNRLGVWYMLAIIVLLGWLGSIVYPHLIAALGLSDGAAAPQQVEQRQSVEEEFDPYAPITIVPNDYEE